MGAGTGILSLFAKQAGAARVFAVEASGMAAVLRELVALNDPEGVIEVVEGRAEEVEVGAKVDVLVSEWMGFYLLHESMLDSVILARDRHLQVTSPPGSSPLTPALPADHLTPAFNHPLFVTCHCAG